MSHIKKYFLLYLFLGIVFFAGSFWMLAKELGSSSNEPIEDVTIAILAKDKAHLLPLYLSCIERQTWPAKKTHLYIRTNNNNDNTAEILREWIKRVGDRYASVYMDDSDVPEQVQRFGQHEWNSERFKVLGKIRQDSVNWAHAHKTHYFVVDCDNFIYPQTLEELVKVNLPVVAPLLRVGGTNLYSNFHAAVDGQGYFANSPLYMEILVGLVRGLVQVPVVHCSYLIRHEVQDKIYYDDDSFRYEYVIFSDSCRKNDIPQYLDNRQMYGRLSFTENADQFSQEEWLHEFQTAVN